MTFTSLIKQYKRHLLIAIFCMFLSNAASLVLPWGIKLVIDGIINHHPADHLRFILLICLAASIGKSIFTYFHRISSNIFGEKISAQLKENLFWHTLKMPLKDIKRTTPAQILTRLSDDVSCVRRFLLTNALDAIYASINILLIFLILGWINLKLCGIALCAFPFFILVYRHIIPQAEKNYAHVKSIKADQTSRISETLHGMEVVRSFSGESNEKNLFDLAKKKIVSLSILNHKMNAFLWATIDLFASLGIISVLWFGSKDVLASKMSPGELIAFYTYCGMLFSPIVRLIGLTGSYKEAAASLTRINDILEKHITTASKKKHLPLIKTKINGAIEFKNVNFKYTDDNYILKNISFSINPGETIAIIGPSGAGKTTLISLLAGLLSPESGTIEVDQTDIDGYELNAYRKQCTIVVQDNHLFTGSIKDNICYGINSPDKDEMITAATYSCAIDFIEKLPKGYETHLEDRGRNLSSGQRQRIAIARALIRNPRILIMDESTSAVDAFTENIIQNTIHSTFKNTTTIIVAHRFSSIVHADKIIVLKNGMITEIGGHEYLLNKNGFYSSLYFEQFKNPDKIKLESSIRK
ncbi:ABC transporter ATP-binding protein [Candidatus Omnitrophota bacterium]